MDDKQVISKFPYLDSFADRIVPLGNTAIIKFGDSVNFKIAHKNLLCKAMQCNLGNRLKSLDDEFITFGNTDDDDDRAFKTKLKLVYSPFIVNNLEILPGYGYDNLEYEFIEEKRNLTVELYISDNDEVPSYLLNKIKLNKIGLIDCSGKDFEDSLARRQATM